MGIYESVSIWVELPEALHEFLLSVGVLHFSYHETLELFKIDGAVSILINFLNHILELSLGRILAKWSHDCTKLLGRDSLITILVKKRESFFELSFLLVG